MKTLLLLICLTACAGGGKPGQFTAPIGDPQIAREFIEIIPHIIDAIPAGVRQGRPLLIDVRSFQLAGSSLTGGDLLRTEVERAIGREYRDVPADQAAVRQSDTHYAIADGGVHIRLDGISREGGVYRALLTYQYTDVREASSAIGGAQIYVTLFRRRGKWEIVGSRTMWTT